MRILLIMMFAVVVNLLNSCDAHAQNTGLERTAKVEGGDALQQIRQQINNLITQISTFETILAAAAACGDDGKQYGNAGCVDLAERDPLVHNHGKRAVTSACTASNSAPYFSLASGAWTCKTLSN